MELDLVFLGDFLWQWLICFCWDEFSCFLVVLVLVDLKSLRRAISPSSSIYRGLLWN